MNGPTQQKTHNGRQQHHEWLCQRVGCRQIDRRVHDCHVAMIRATTAFPNGSCPRRAFRRYANTTDAMQIATTPPSIVTHRTTIALMSINFRRPRE